MADDPLHQVEAAMVAIRRRQSRRSLARAAGLPESGALFGVLDALEAASGPVVLGSIAELLGVDQPRASKLVAQAVRRGLVRRAADQNDGRRSLLILTADGTDAVASVRQFRRDRFAAAMADWTDQDRTCFAALLTRFVAALDAAPAAASSE